MDEDYMLLREGNGSPFQFVIKSFGYAAYLGVMGLVGVLLNMLLYTPHLKTNKRAA